MALALTPFERRGVVLLIIAIVAVRLATLGAYPLMDSTESRYAEIARIMVESGNWMTPQVESGVPFWGKPPLSTWLSAGSMAAFGINEFAARLPSFLSLVACGALVAMLARRRGDRDHVLWVLLLYATMMMIAIAAGAVMTDPSLALGTTLAMVGFWSAIEGSATRRLANGAVFFVGLAIGLLAKGPVALVLVFIPLVLWTLLEWRWLRVWRALPWVLGVGLTAALVVPWYWLEERMTPGFLEYFLVGEHWRRFVDSGWKGDLYGAAHAHPRGTIWAYWVFGALPWSIVAIAWVGRVLTRQRAELHRLLTDPWLCYLLLWAIAPMLFFTLARNVLPTYVLPGLPAFALLIGEVWRPKAMGSGVLRPTLRTVIGGGAIALVAILGLLAFMHQQLETQRSHKALVATYEARREDASERLIYVGQRPMSAEFYTRGQMISVADVAALEPYVADQPADFIVLRNDELAALPAATRSALSLVGQFGESRLYREKPR